MDPTQINQFVTILRNSQRLNPKDPVQLAKAQKVLRMANDLRTRPNLPPEITAELTRFYDSIGARPEVAGIKTTVQGNRWEDTVPSPIPLGALKKV